MLEKLLPYILSHKGVVYKIKFIQGATHISFAKFLVLILPQFPQLSSILVPQQSPFLQNLGDFGGALAPIGEGALASVGGPPGYYKNLHPVLTLDVETVVVFLEELMVELLLENLGSHL